MALAKAALVSALQSAFEDLSGKTAAQKAQAIADAIDTFVKTGTVTVSVTSVSGVTTGPGVSGPGTGTGTIS